MNQAQFMQFASDMAHDCFYQSADDEHATKELEKLSHAEMAAMLRDFLDAYVECIEDSELVEKRLIYQASRG